jgi:mono/diheme cytochrome c family protein
MKLGGCRHAFVLGFASVLPLVVKVQPLDLPPLAPEPLPLPPRTNRVATSVTKSVSTSVTASTRYTIPPSPTHPLAAGVLAWDAVEKTVKAKPGETAVDMKFAVTNVSKGEIAINYIRTSCGCTIPQMPSQPWRLAPGEGGSLPFHVDIRGKSGLLTKVANIETSQGFTVLILNVDIPGPAPGTTSMNDRLRNLEVAAADRQAVFQGDCAQCHVAPGVGKTGELLYVSVCGICHDAEQRAAMVPDLKAVATPGDKDYWRRWIACGKPGSLMPAFAAEQDGPLSDEQIDSLVKFLLERPLPNVAPARMTSPPTSSAPNRAPAPAPVAPRP